MSGRRRTSGTSAGLALAMVAALLAGCAAAPPETPAPPSSPAPAPEPTPSDTPTPVASFAMPRLCSEILPTSRTDHLAELGMTLLAGPDGAYGDSYLAEPTPEQLAGGITCIWGEEAVPENTVMISVAPVSAATHDGIVDALVAQSLNERVDGDALVYERQGDEVSTSAIVNVVREDSWISVFEGLGGAAFHDEALQIADEVAQQVGAE